MLYYSAPILVAGTSKPSQWELGPDYAGATRWLETKAKNSGITFREGSQVWSQLAPYATLGTPLHMQTMIVAVVVLGIGIVSYCEHFIFPL